MPVYSRVASDRTSTHSCSILQLNLSEIKTKLIFFRTYVTLEITQKTEHFNVVLLNFCIYISSVNQMQVAPSVCNVESLSSSQIINLSKVNLIKLVLLGWEIFLTLFKFICSYITKPGTPNDANFTSDKFCNFPTKINVKFTTLFRSSRFDWQICNETAKFVAIFGNFKRSSETVCQKFCESHCKINADQDMQGLSNSFSQTKLQS